MKIVCRGTPIATQQNDANAKCSQPDNATSSGLSGAAGSQPSPPIIAPPSGRDPQSPPLKRCKAGLLKNLGDMGNLVPSQYALQKWGDRAPAEILEFMNAYVCCAEDAQPGAKRRYEPDDQGLAHPEDAKRDDADAEPKVQQEVPEVDDWSHCEGGVQLDEGKGDNTTTLQPDAGGTGDVRFPAEDGHEEVRLPAKDGDEQVRRSKVVWQQSPCLASAQWEDVYPELQTRLEEERHEKTFVYTGMMYGCSANFLVDMERMVYKDNDHGGQQMNLQRIQQTVICSEAPSDAQFSVTAELEKMPRGTTYHWQMKMNNIWKYMSLPVHSQIMDHIWIHSEEPVVNVDHHYRTRENIWKKTVYTIDLKNMTQTNTGSGTKRPIQLVGEKCLLHWSGSEV